MKKKPVYVNTYYNGLPEFEQEGKLTRDQKIEKIAIKHDGEETGSGYGCDGRDVNFTFKSIASANRFRQEIKKKKLVDGSKIYR